MTRGLQRAWHTARTLLEHHAIKTAPIDVRSIAKQYAHLLERPLDPEISGILIPSTKAWAIVVNSDHPRARQHFTIAHELGHIFLHQYTLPHADRAFKFRDAKSSEGSVLEEVQANQFAAELLMPRALVIAAAKSFVLDHTDESDDEFQRAVVKLAGVFDVSRQAMTIRLSSLLA